MKFDRHPFFADAHNIGQRKVAQIMEETYGDGALMCARVLLSNSRNIPESVASHTRMLHENLRQYRRARNVQTMLDSLEVAA